MSLRSALSQVRGLGSAKAGTHHWWMQRVTAIAMVPLAIWFASAVIALAPAEHDVVVAWISEPVSAILLILFITNLFYHVRLGLQVVIEDYVHGEGAKIAALLFVTFLSIALGAACIFSVLRIAFGG
ncbi:MAG: succinate dehydrogenase, hydrophobic membrane anchor protein [Pseudomonadota bacterium]